LGPEAGGLPAGGEVLAPEEVHQGPLGGANDGGDHLGHPSPIGLVSHASGHGDRMGLGRHGQQPFQLLDGLAHDDPGGRQAGLDSLAEVLHVGCQVGGVGPQAGEKPLQTLGVVRPLELGHLREDGLGTAHLVDAGQAVETELLFLQGEATDDEEELAGDPVFHREIRGIHGLGGSDGLPGQGHPASPPLGAGIFQPIVVSLVPVEGGGGGVELQKGLPEALSQRVDGRGLQGCLHGSPFLLLGGRAELIHAAVAGAGRAWVPDAAHRRSDSPHPATTDSLAA
jgi:hypothetical protein